MASKGTSKFILQRATAVVLLPLMLWFLVSLIGHAGASHFIMRDWLLRPVLMLLNWAFAIVVALISIWSILSLAFG